MHSESRQFRAMGSTAHVVALEAAPVLVDWAIAEINRLEQLWSRFIPTSEVSRLNEAAGREPIAVHSTTLRAVEHAVEAWRQTAGWFDPTILASLEALGYRNSFDPTDDAVRGNPELITPAPGCSGIVIDRDEGTVYVPAGTRIDLGGVGKGLAADIVAEGLVDRGALGAAVGMGGDVRVYGIGPDDGRWDIDVEHPLFAGNVLFVAPLHDDADCAIVTSTRMIRRWNGPSGDLHHLIDPTTGSSAVTQTAAVIVASREAWWAESLAKAALVSGEEGEELLNRHRVAGWIVGITGLVTPTAIAQEAPWSQH